MEENKCPFSAPLVTRQFACASVQEAFHRGGTEVNCTDAAAHARCDRLFQQLKQGVLPAFGVEDDLLSMPHSVQVNIQYGGLLGLQRLLHAGMQVGERVENVQALVAEVARRFSDEAHARSWRTTSPPSNRAPGADDKTSRGKR